MVDPPDPEPSDPHPASPERFRGTRTGRRLRTLAALQIEHGEELVEWTRGWVSRDGRFRLLAARTRDFVVLTDRRIALWSCGFFTRRPRRNVFDQMLDRVVVDDIGKRPLRSLRVTGFQRRPLRFDFGADASGRVIAAALVGLPDVTEAGSDRPEGPKGGACPS